MADLVISAHGDRLLVRWKDGYVQTQLNNGAWKNAIVCTKERALRAVKLSNCWCILYEDGTRYISEDLNTWQLIAVL
jgi:hypothetical protein